MKPEGNIFFKKIVLFVCLVLVAGLAWSIGNQIYLGKSTKKHVHLCLEESSDIYKSYFGSFDAFPNVTKVNCMYYLAEPQNTNLYSQSCAWMKSNSTRTGQYLPENCNVEKRNTVQNDETLLYHVFWVGKWQYNPLGILTETFLLTQQLRRSKLIIWFYPNYTGQVDFHLQQISTDVVEIRMFNLSVEMNGTCIAESGFMDHILKKVANESKLQQFSDIARILILRNYGGVYLDADVLLLKDLRPFVESIGEFAPTFWFQNWNNHILSFRKKSKSIEGLTQAICKFPYNDTIENLIDTNPNDILKYWPFKPFQFPETAHTPHLEFQWNDGVIRYCFFVGDCDFNGVHLGIFDPQWGCKSTTTCSHLDGFPVIPDYVKPLPILHSRSSHDESACDVTNSSNLYQAVLRKVNKLISKNSQGYDLIPIYPRALFDDQDFAMK